MAVKSAERVLKIFDLLEGSSDGLTNKDISTRLNYAPSSTIALLQTMAENGYLAVDEQKRYSLGGKLVSLGAVAASRFDIGRMATPYLKHLMQTLGETCFLGVLSQGEIVYIAKENCERTINTNAQIGSRKPVYCTGLGKAFLSFLPPEESREIYRIYGKYGEGRGRIEKATAGISSPGLCDGRPGDRRRIMVSGSSGL